MSEIVTTVKEFEMVIDESNQAVTQKQPIEDVLEYIGTNSKIVCARLQALTEFGIADEHEEAEEPVDDVTVLELEN